jgi:hypothetical protein
MDMAKKRMQEAVARSDEELTRSEQETADEREAKDVALSQLAYQTERTNVLQAHVSALQEQLYALQDVAVHEFSIQPHPDLRMAQVV